MIVEEAVNHFQSQLEKKQQNLCILVTTLISERYVNITLTND